MASDFDRQALLNIFTTEASDGLLKLANALDPRDGSTPSQEALREHFIIAHSLTGSSSLYGFTGCASLAKILARILEQAGTVSPTEWLGTVTILRDIVTILRAQIDHINQESTEDPTIFEGLKARYAHLLREFEPTPPGAEPAPEEASLPDSYFRPDLEAEILEYFVPEAQEYLEVISSCLLRMEKDPANTDTIHQLFRAAHTLKGSAYTVGDQATPRRASRRGACDGGAPSSGGHGTGSTPATCRLERTKPGNSPGQPGSSGAAAQSGRRIGHRAQPLGTTVDGPRTVGTPGTGV